MSKAKVPSSLDNREGKQKLSASYILSSMFLFGLSVAITVSVLARRWNGTEDTRVHDQAESLALQLANAQYEKVAKVGGRAPASVPSQGQDERGLVQAGEIGRDDWGEAYSYRLLMIEEGRAMLVSVWSGGPNRQNDSQKMVELGTSASQIEFISDDIGVAMRIPVPQ